MNSNEAAQCSKCQNMLKRLEGTFCDDCGVIELIVPKIQADPRPVDPLSDTFLGPGGPRPQFNELKYGIMHPSDRALGLDFSNSKREVWGADEPLLFDTREEAEKRINERAKEFPNSDWPEARVVPCRPGKPRVYPVWEWNM